MRIKKIAVFTAALMLMIPAAAYIAADGGFSFVVSAEEKIQKDDFVFEVISDGTAVLNSYTGEAEDVVIPSSVTDDAGNEYKVTVLGSRCFANNKMLSSVTIPATVTGFDNTEGIQFDGCTNLQKVIFEEGSELKEIPYGVFYGCKTLWDINLPDSVVSIGESAFEGCTSLKNISLNGVKYIGGSAFRSSGLESVELPVIVNIGINAFYGNNSLTSVSLGEGLKTVGEQAFFNCKNLKSLKVPESVSDIGSAAFGGYSSGFLTGMVEDFTIYGKPGTAAENYVILTQENGFPMKFVDISTSEPVTPSDSNFANGIYCDVNGDGSANVMDLALMKKYLLLGE